MGVLQRFLRHLQGLGGGKKGTVVMTSKSSFFFLLNAKYQLDMLELGILFILIYSALYCPVPKVIQRFSTELFLHTLPSPGLKATLSLPSQQQKGKGITPRLWQEARSGLVHWNPDTRACPPHPSQPSHLHLRLCPSSFPALRLWWGGWTWGRGTQAH